MAPSMLHTIHLAHMPPGLAVLVGLYKDVQNASSLKEQLLAGNAEFEYAFVDASMVLSTTHILAATFRAMNDFLNERLKSRNIHSEIVFALSPNNNIGEAFRRYGVGDSTKSLLVLKVATSPEITFDGVTAHLEEVVKGTAVPFDDIHLQDLSDLAKIKKAYKVGSAQAPKTGKAPKPLTNGTTSSASTNDERRELETSVLGLMALRGAT